MQLSRRGASRKIGRGVSPHFLPLLRETHRQTPFFFFFFTRTISSQKMAALFSTKEEKRRKVPRDSTKRSLDICLITFHSSSPLDLLSPLSLFHGSRRGDPPSLISSQEIGDSDVCLREISFVFFSFKNFKISSKGNRDFHLEGEQKILLPLLRYEFSLEQ